MPAGCYPFIPFLGTKRVNGTDEKSLKQKIAQKMTDRTNIIATNLNIAGRLPENSRNRFVDRQSKKTVEKTDQKIPLIIEG